MTAEFKISRLRFSWVGEWESSKEYNRDQIVQYEGKSYVCLIPHTSAVNFYDDLNALNSKWDLMFTGQTWRAQWEPNTQYSLDNIVIFGGIVYKCLEQHISKTFLDQDIEKWQIYSESKVWKNDWQLNTTYGIGDLVRYGGTVYECIVSHVSKSTELLGLESDLSKWQILHYGVSFVGEYSSDVRYKLNDLTKLGPSLFRCIVGHEATSTFNPSNWQEWLPGIEYKNTWDPAVIYQPGEIVKYGGYVYFNKILNNINLKPSTNSGPTDPWEVVVESITVEGEWNSNTEYKVGSLVRYGGLLYGAISDNTNQIPTSGVQSAVYVSAGSSGTTFKVTTTAGIVKGMMLRAPGFTRGQIVNEVVDNETLLLNEGPDSSVTNGELISFTGVNKQYWELIIPGTRWRGRWEQDESYQRGDLAYWRNATYRCVFDHISTSLNRPDIDPTSQFWVIYTLHSQTNVLNNKGEIVVYTSEGNQAISIGNETAVLKSVNGLPVWSEIFITPAVYYVATNGIDSPDRGNTWDTPWRTIRYACDRVINGTLNQNAKFLILENKEFIVAEALQWMIYQIQNQISPFIPPLLIDNDKTVRDSKYIIDAILFDLIRGGNSQTVAATLAYFDLQARNKYTNEEVEAQVEYFIAVIEVVFEYLNYALTNTVPPVSYQTLNSVADPVEQVINLDYTVEPQALTIVSALENILLTALTEGNVDSIPPANQGLSVTINIKSGTYEENLPIVVPANTALNGDELRGVVVRPANVVNTVATRTIGDINIITVGSTVNMNHNTPVQFVSLNPVTEINTVFGGLTAGQTYYVIGSSITPTSIQVSAVPDGAPVPLLTNIGNMRVYGGGALNDMFRVQNGTGIRNMTLAGLLGTLTEENEYLTRRPTGGSYVALDPGENPDDTRSWIIRKSPYIQNVTNFGTGCVGLKIDSTLHNGGNRSIVCNDFTQIISDGIGIWCTGGEALCEAVSVFSYYNYAGYFSEDGGRIRATNGNSSYGTYGCVAEGFDPSETPTVGTVNNKSTQATAQAITALGAQAEILKIQYTHAGENYKSSTTNLLKNSNNFLNSSSWTSDGNINILQAPSSPYTDSSAWEIEGITSLSDTSYFYQTLTAYPQGKVYSGLSGTNLTGSGIGATFDVTVTAEGYQVSVNNGGSGYVVGNQIVISGKVFGGRQGINDIIITVQSLAISSILTVTISGLVPEGTALPYTLSIHAKKGTSASFDLYAIFSGVETVTSAVNYNFDTQQIIASSPDSTGVVPYNTNIQFLGNEWYRISFTVYDITARNTSLEFRIYPRGRNGIAGSTNFYGSQLQLGEDLTFYLETASNIPTAYANYNITGAGSGVKVIGDETRSGSVFQSRILQGNTSVGGRGYKTQSNNSQGGTEEYIILAQSEVATPAEYQTMRLTVQSGRGAGQYGIISKYDPITKYAYVLKESFDTAEIVGTNSANDRFILSSLVDFNTIYQGQKIQFTPTFYDRVVSSVAQNQIEVTATQGDLNNRMIVSSTTRLTVGMPITFTGTVFGGVITNFTYYVLEIVDSTTIQISTSLGGGVWPLVNETGTMQLNYPSNTSFMVANSTNNMEVTYPIQFTGVSLGGVTLGETYYINEIYSATEFSISNSLVNITVTGTNSANNSITCDNTAGLTELTPIIFKGSSFGNLQAKTKYYINSKIDGISFTVASSVLDRTVTATQAGSNLITVNSTTGFIPNYPIVFTGTTFGGIINDKVYYIQVINDSTSFTISLTPGGAAVPLSTAVGEIRVRTAENIVTQTTTAGSLQGVTTSTKRVLESGSGEMKATFYTETFGGISEGTTYYVLEKTFVPAAGPDPARGEFTITDTVGGIIPVSLISDTGSMQIGEVGWDNINPGTPNVQLFDSTSVYVIEPRVKFTSPPFEEVFVSAIPPLAGPEEYNKIAYGNGYFVALPDSGDKLYTTSGANVVWNQSITLPTTGNWTDLAYGNKTWVIISSSGTPSKVLYSVSDGQTWLESSLPSVSTWNHLAYGNGVFVAIASNTSKIAYSTNNGQFWSEGTGLPNSNWSDITYGAEKFVAISSGSSVAAYSSDGIGWTMTSLPASSTWSSVKYGNGRFVAISSTSRKSAYSFDGITWYNSSYEISGTSMAYGQGTFVVITKGSATVYISPDGINWRTNTIIPTDYNDITFGFDQQTDLGIFYTIGDSFTSTVIKAGSKPQARTVVNDGIITSISFWETGSNYTVAPDVQVIDPNNSEDIELLLRIGNNSLSAPTFISQGQGYNTNSTSITVTGDGFADKFQTGLRFVAKNLTKLPSPGDNLEFVGNSQVYKVAAATILNGTEAPNLDALIQVSPSITEDLSPGDNTQFTVRSKYSQVRLTNHDFLNIGYGNERQSNYPDLPLSTGLAPQDEIVETNNGRVFYSSTDQDGNFRVGDLFSVEQATGIVTLNASEFGLEGLTELSIGGVAIGGSEVVITQFSTDGTFLANSNQIVPTQRAIRTYLASRLSQGGSDTFTGQLIAGTVKIGGPDEIGSTVPENQEGWKVNIPVKVMVAGPTAAWAGDGLAMSYFMKTWWR